MDVSEFKGLVSWLVFKILLFKLTKGNRHKLNVIKHIHSKDFGLAPNYGIDANKLIYNYLDKVLCVEQDVLNIGCNLLYLDINPILWIAS